MQVKRTIKWMMILTILFYCLIPPFVTVAVSTDDSREEIKTETQSSVASTAEAGINSLEENQTMTSSEMSIPSTTEYSMKEQGQTTDTGKEEAEIDGTLNQRTVPLEKLKQELKARNKATTSLKVSLFSNESNVRLTEAGVSGYFDYQGGKFSEENVSIKQWISNRTFRRAAYKINGSAQEFPILGLYSYEGKWFYTVATDETKNKAINDQIEAEVGVELDTANSEVILYYELDTEPAEVFTINQTFSNNKADIWAVNLKDQAQTNEQVVFSFNVPTEFSSATITVSQNNTVLYTFNTETPNQGSPLELIDTANRRYTGVFKMPKGQVTVAFSGRDYVGGTDRWFGIGWEGQDGFRNGKLYQQVFNTISVAGKPQNLPSYTIKSKNFSSGPTTTIKSQSGLQNQTTNYRNSTNGRHTNSFSTAIGKFKVGEEIVLELETGHGLYQYVEKQSFRFTPVVLVVDAYTKGYHDQNQMITDLVSLPTGKGKVQIQDLSNGGKVKIEVVEYEAPLTIDKATLNKARFKYKLTFSNMRYDFSTYINTVSGAQQNFFFDNLTGIQLGESLDDLSKSYLDYVIDWNPVKIPLSTGISVMGKFAGQGDILAYIKPRYGYSKPTVTLKNRRDPQSMDIADDKDKYTEALKKGYYLYQLKSGGGNDGIQPATGVDISAEPISFKIQYYNNESMYYEETTKLKPSEDKNYAVKEKIPTKTKNTNEYFYGYKVVVIGSDNSRIEISPKNGSYWRPQELVDIRVVYDKLIENDKLSEQTEYTIRLEAQTGTSENGAYMRSSFYTTVQQSFSEASDTTKNQELSKLFPNGAFTRNTEDIYGYNQSNITLVGHKDVYQQGSTKYLLSGKSKTSVKLSKDTFAELVYLKAITVTYDKDSLGQNPNMSYDESTLYVGVNGDTGQVDGKKYSYEKTLYKADGSPLDEMNPGTITDYKFIGWKIKNAALDAQNYIITPSSNGKINFYELGLNYPETWEKVFTEGTLILEAVYEPKYYEITGENNDYTPFETSLETFTGGTKEQTDQEYGFTISSTFSYQGDWSDQDKKLKFALYKKSPDGQHQLLATEAGVKENFKEQVSSGNIEAKDGKLMITFRIKNVDEDGKPSIRYDQENGHSYLIYAWNDKNGELNVPDTSEQAPINGKVPLSQTNVTVLPTKIESKNGGISNESNTKITISPGENFTVSADFSYDYFYPHLEQWQENKNVVDYADKKQLHVALFKKITDENGVEKYELWGNDEGSYQNGVEDGLEKVGKPNITFNEETGKMNVTFAIKNISLSDGKDSINYDSDNGANYKIISWNYANIANTSVDDIANDSTHHSDLISSVTTPIEVFQDPEYYLTIPTMVQLDDHEGKVLDSSGKDQSNKYAGKEQMISFDATKNSKTWPSFKAEIEDNVKMTASGRDVDDRFVDIYFPNGLKNPSVEKNGSRYSVLGYLDKNSEKTEIIENGLALPVGENISFRLNTRRSLYAGDTYFATLKYIFTLQENGQVEGSDKK